MVTYNRPEHLRRCLQRIRQQTVAPSAILVIDASPDERSRDLVRAEFAEVRYLRNSRGRGTTATSRDIALRACSTDVLAFLDDDALAEPTWLEQLLIPYRDPSVGGVGGRVRNGQPGEDRVPTEGIGVFLPNGALTGNFAADPGTVIDVDHLLGASMSFRTAAVRDNGGIHDHYPGTCLLEESDIALRMKRAGRRVVFTPFAVVDHLPGPYAKGRRFDLRYVYYAQRNHLVMLGQIVGFRDPRFRHYLRHVGRQSLVATKTSLAAAGMRQTGSGGASLRRAGGAILRLFVTLAGVGAGFAVATRNGVRRPAPESVCL